MKKSKWLDCQGNEFFPKLKGTPSLVKIEHKNTATLDSARSKKKYKVAVLQLLWEGTFFKHPVRLFSLIYNESALWGQGEYSPFGEFYLEYERCCLQ